MKRWLLTAVATLGIGCSLSGALAAAGPISLDVRDLDIYDTVRLLSTQASVNVVVDSSVAHRPVSLRLQHVSFSEALATLIAANDLQAVHVGNVIYVGTSEAMNRRYPANTAGTRTVLFAVKNGTPDDVAKSLTDALPKGTLVVPDRRTASIIVTGSPTTVARARDLVAALDQTSGLANVVVPMRYVKASDALKAVQATLQVTAPSSAYASDQQNAVILTGSHDFITLASSLIARVDRPGQQVRYEVRVTDLSPSETSNVGFLFGGADENGVQHPGSGSTVTTFLRDSLAINATINALVTRGEAKILARPTLSSLNNVAASLLVGQQYPIVYFDARTGTQQVQFVNVGVNLNVTPTIGTDGAITTDLETDYSQVTGTISSFPIITTRKAQSTLRVRDGETIVIAGLFADIDTATLTKVPFLGDIPFIGEVFRNRARQHSKDEVVFLITPHLVADSDPAATTARRHDGALRIPMQPAHLVPELALARVITAGGPYGPGDEISLAFTTPSISRLVAHDPALRATCVPLEGALVPEMISVVITHAAAPFSNGDVLALSFVDPRIARVYLGTERQGSNVVSDVTTHVAAADDAPHATPAERSTPPPAPPAHGIAAAEALVHRADVEPIERSILQATRPEYRLADTDGAAGIHASDAGDAAPQLRAGERMTLQRDALARSATAPESFARTENDGGATLAGFSPESGRNSAFKGSESLLQSPPQQQLSPQQSPPRPPQQSPPQHSPAPQSPPQHSPAPQSPSQQSASQSPPSQQSAPQQSLPQQAPQHALPQQSLPPQSPPQQSLPPQSPQSPQSPQHVAGHTRVTVRLEWNQERLRRFVQVVDKLFTIDRLRWYRHSLAMRLLIPDDIACGDTLAGIEAMRHLQALRAAAVESLGKPLLAACMPGFSITSEWLDSIESPREARAISGLREALLPYADDDERAIETPTDRTFFTTGTIVRCELLAENAASVEAFLPLLIAPCSHDAALGASLAEYRRLLVELFTQTARAGEPVRLHQMAQANHSLDDRLWQVVGAAAEAFGGFALT